MDEKIISTINKIKLLAEQNPEFSQAMQKLFGKTVSASEHFSNQQENRIDHIEKYLGLDYFVDSMNAIIDYSFIQELDVRSQLISDNREMLRFRYGTRFHKVDFEEFCRYVQLQAEMLINYFYYHKDSSIKDAINHIKKFNPSAKIDDKNSTLASISFSTKLWAFNDEFSLKIKDIFDLVRDVRNNQSHRNPKFDDFSISKYQQDLERQNIKLKSDGFVDWYSTKKNSEIAYNIFVTRIKKTEEFKLYNYKIFIINKPFDTIIEKLKIVANTVKSQLS